MSELQKHNGRELIGMDCVGHSKPKDLEAFVKMVGSIRIELMTPCMSSKCSTAELTAQERANHVAPETKNPK